MPAAAVIPAPIAYIPLAAVKASVVEFRSFEMDAAASRKFACAFSFELG